MASNKFSQAAKEVEGFASQFRGILGIAETLREIGGFERVVANHEARIEELKKEQRLAEERIAEAAKAGSALVDAAEARAKEVDAAARALLEKAEAVKLAAEDEAKRLRSTAEDIVRAAEQRVRAIEADGVTKSQEAKASADQIVAEARFKAGARLSEAEAAEKRLAAALVETEAEQKKLKSMQDEIARLKSRFAT